MSSLDASASMLNVTLMSLKPLRTSLSATEDPADVVRALDRRGDRAQLDAAVLRDDATPAVRQLARPTMRYSIGVMPLSVAAKTSGWSALEHRLLQVVVLLAEAEEAVHLDLAVDAVLPTGRTRAR